ncbi:MAG: ferredoxin, partial [Candidatus Azotimanducaceae bacterium]
MGISNIIFLVLLVVAGFFFAKNVRKIQRNINLGRDINRSDNKRDRWKTMAKVALGQSKMTKRPVAGFLHLLVYVGFVIINIEVIEIIIDGVFGTHRILSFLGGFYDILIGSFEVLALLVLVACLLFLARRNIIRVKRFLNKEMDGWPKTDANLILIFEVLLMSAFLLMNASDYLLQGMGAEHYTLAGSYPISAPIAGLLGSMSQEGLVLLERTTWWFHIVGILAFMNYLPISKHFHIILAFPNTWFSNLNAKGRFTNMEAVTEEVKMMMDPNADPYAAPDPNAPAPERFGAKDVTDLNWVQLMNAYTCTECGRCTSECPASQTGKLLSPRKIMMDTRDRLEEKGKLIAAKGLDADDGRSLLDTFISREELWACTSCNACTEA